VYLTFKKNGNKKNKIIFIKKKYLERERRDPQVIQIYRVEKESSWSSSGNTPDTTKYILAKQATTHSS
jgi:hypothetical protein